MSGITGLVDTLLAVKLSQRLDLLTLKPEARLARPEAPIAAARVDNDVRLPSHAALDREIAAPPSSPRLPAANTQPPVHLTLVARLIDSLLGAGTAPAGPVRGTAPLLPLAATAPSVPALAQALAQTVSGSGLFYESHLQQFSLGTRPLAQLADEPQARLTAQAAPRDRGEATLIARTPEPTGRAPEASAPAPLAPAVHPATLPLVQQQLSLLATDAFCWSGQAWPGVPMDWTIEQERAQPDTQADAAEAPPRRWRTTLALTLPNLGPVELTLSLSEQDVQARLVAADPATRERLTAHGDDLVRRLAGAGLRLQALQVARPPEP